MGTVYLASSAISANLWSPQGYFVKKDGTVSVDFAEDISGNIQTNNGDAAIKDDKRTLLIAAPINPEPSTIVVSGVRYAKLFPSYTFTFTVNVVEKTASLMNDLALNVLVRAAASETANTPANAVDGDPATRWAASSGSYPNYIEVDLGAVYPLEQISVAWYESSSSPRAYRYEIWAKSNTITDWSTVPGVGTDFAGSGYTKVVDKTSSDVIEKTTDSLSGVSARYILVNCTGTSTGSGSPSIYSIDVMGWK